MTSENTHNSGRIKWNTLLEAITKKERLNKDTNEVQYEWYVDENKLDYFSRNVEEVIQDYANTYKKEIPNDLNPIQWSSGDWRFSAGAQICYADSLLVIYIQLNLILLNSYLNDIPIFFNGEINSVMEGDGDLEPGEYIIRRFKTIRPLVFGETNKYTDTIKKVNKLSKESVGEVKAFLKEIFICLISLYRSTSHKVGLSSKKISENIEWYYKLKCV